VNVTTWEITVKLVLALLVAAMPLVANAWGVAGMQYVNPPPEPQPNPQPSYSEQYNAGYMDAYQSSHGYAADSGHGPAYLDGYHAAWKAEHRQ
jgi:hypothetical protein